MRPRTTPNPTGYCSSVDISLTFRSSLSLMTAQLCDMRKPLSRRRSVGLPLGEMTQNHPFLEANKGRLSGAPSVLGWFDGNGQSRLENHRCVAAGQSGEVVAGGQSRDLSLRLGKCGSQVSLIVIFPICGASGIVTIHSIDPGRRHSESLQSWNCSSPPIETSPRS